MAKPYGEPYTENDKRFAWAACSLAATGKWFSIADATLVSGLTSAQIVITMSRLSIAVVPHPNNGTARIALRSEIQCEADNWSNAFKRRIQLSQENLHLVEVFIATGTGARYADIKASLEMEIQEFYSRVIELQENSILFFKRDDLGFELHFIPKETLEYVERIRRQKIIGKDSYADIVNPATGLYDDNFRMENLKRQIQNAPPPTVNFNNVFAPVNNPPPAHSPGKHHPLGAFASSVIKAVAIIVVGGLVVYFVYRYTGIDLQHPARSSTTQQGKF